MRGRLPFPDPLLPVVLIAMMIALIMPACLHLVKEWNVREGKSGNHDTGCNTGIHQKHDSFSGPGTPHPVGDTQAKITTKFISFGSGTEELGFDWIVTPFESTAQPGSSDGEESSYQLPDSMTPVRSSED